MKLLNQSKDNKNTQLTDGSTARFPRSFLSKFSVLSEVIGHLPTSTELDVRCFKLPAPS